MSAPARRKHRAFDWSALAIAVLAYHVGGGGVSSATARTRFLAILVEDLGLFGVMIPKVLAGCLIGAFVTLLLPRETVARWVGAESGFGGIVIATIAGAILPGGPFTIYPVAAAFLAVGADVGAACAFVVAWSLLGYTRAIVWELPFFGLDFVTWRIIVSLPLPIIAGLSARAVWNCWSRESAGPRMNLIIDIALWTIVVALALAVFLRRRPNSCRAALRRA